MSFTNLNNNEISCRICLEDEYSENMVYPCKCDGTSKYVHKTCLNQWRTLSNNPEAYKKCFECHYQYKFAHPENIEQIQTGFLTKCFRHMATNIIAFLAINMCTISIFALLLSLIDTKRVLPSILFANYTRFDNSDKVQVDDAYLLWSSIIYLSILFTIAFINFINIKRNKILYLKNYCRNKSTFGALVIILLVIIFAMDTIFGLTILTVCLQILIRLHFNSLEKIKRENIVEILNYEPDLENNDDITNNIEPLTENTSLVSNEIII